MPVLHKLSRRDRWAVMAALAAVTLFFLLRFIVFPLVDQLPEYRTRLEQKELTLQHYQRLVSESTRHQFRQETAAERLESLEAGLLESASPSLANAEWQRLVRELAESRGIELGRSEFLPLQELDPHYGLVSGRVQFRCRLDQLIDFLSALGTSPKLLGVPRIRVLALSGERERPLNVEVTIAAVISLAKPAAATEADRE